MATVLTGNMQSNYPGPTAPGQPWYYDQNQSAFNFNNYAPRRPILGGPTTPVAQPAAPTPTTAPRPTLPRPTSPSGTTPAPTAMPTVQTTITPTNLYTPQMTQAAVNQAIASNTPDSRFAQKANYTPGVSRSAGTLAAATPALTQGIWAQRQGAAEIPLLDEIANQKHMLAGQVGRENEAQSLASLMQRLNLLHQQESNNSASNYQSVLMSLLGGL